MLTVGGVFTGIGGFELGLERAGMRSVWQCDSDPYAQRVLAKHWPDVLRVPDIRGVNASTVPRVGVIAGGFPCQDVSLTGRGAGLEGARSGLWFEMVRVVGELRPRYVIVENVRALAVRGLDAVLGSLAEIGYDAEWDCLPASAFGAPHQRDRIWIVAYPSSEGLEGPRVFGRPPLDGGSQLGDADRGERGERDAGPRQLGPRGRGEPRDPGWWATEPDVARMAHGVPHRVDRVRALGNALVPQVAEWIGRRIIEHEGLADAA